MTPTLVTEWYLQYNRWLRDGLVRLCGLDQADAEDVLSKVWIRVIRLVDEVDVKTPLQYLRRIALNEVFERSERSRHRLPHHDISDFEPAEDGLGPLPPQLIDERDGAHLVFESAFDEAVREAVEQLPPRQRQLILLHHYEQLTYAQAAEKAGLSRRQVLRGLAKAHELLRHSLRELEGSGLKRGQYRNGLKRGKRRKRNHAKPTPRDATGYTHRLHRKQNDGGHKKHEVDDAHVV